MEPMGSIILSGYYGFDNTGDEAVMYSIIESLRKETKSNIVVLSNNPKKTASTYNVGAVNRWNYKEIISAIRKCDILISGGGSLLQDITGYKSVIYYLSIVLIAKLFRKKVVFYAQGIGPVSVKFNRLLIKWIVNKVDFISVRDEKSKRELIKMGIKKPIDVVIDPVLRLNVVNRKMKETKRVGVYLRHWEVESSFFEIIKEILIWFSNQGWDVIFVPMHYPEDVSIAKEISKQIPNSKTYQGKYLPKDILEFTSTMDYVIGMRLHSLIMAAATEVPYLGLSYDPKVKSFVDTMKVGKALNIDNINKNEAISYLESVINNLDKHGKELKYRKKELLQFSDTPMQFIIKFLSK